MSLRDSHRDRCATNQGLGRGERDDCTPRGWARAIDHRSVPRPEPACLDDESDELTGAKGA